MKRFITVLTLVVSIIGNAQDVHFSQMEFAPLTLNPGLAGANYDLQANVNYRTQWNSVAEPFNTMAFSGDVRLNPNKRNKKGHLALGVSFFNDQAGSAKMTTNNANIYLAYHVMLDKEHTLGGGVYTGFGQRSLNASSGTWGNQYDGTTYNSSLATGENFFTQQFTHFDAGAGLVYTYQQEAFGRQIFQNRINGGIAMYHLNRPGYSFINKADEKLYMRFSAFANGLIGIGDSKIAAEPGVYFQLQGPARELMFGSYLRYQIQEASKRTSNMKEMSAAIGLFYRNRDALIAKAMFQWDGLAIGCAYDFNTSALSAISRARGGVEFFLSWTMKEPFSMNRSRI